MLTRTRRPGAWWISTLVGLAMGVAVVAGEQAPLPPAAALFAKYVDAIGGEAAWKAVTSSRVTGVTEFPAQNIKGTFEIVAGRPNRLILRMDIGGLGRAEAGFDGTIGWTIDPMVGPSLITGAPLSEMKNDSHFDAPLHPADLVASAVTTARTEFDGRLAFKVAITYVSGQKRDEFFDVDTGLLLGTEGESDTPMGKVPSRNVLRDYRSYGALKQPSRLIQTSMGIEQHLIVETMEWNGVPASAFEPPQVVRALIKTALAQADNAPWRADALASFDDAWSTINDSFYDPAFGGLDWQGVKTTLRPKVQAAASVDDARAVIREMLATLERSHFALLSPSSGGEPAPTGSAVVPIDVRLDVSGIVITRVETGSTAEHAGVRAGQRLVAIDDSTADAWIAAAKKESDPRMQAMTAWRRAFVALHGPLGSAARVRVIDDGSAKTLLVPRVTPAGERVVMGDLPPMYVTVRDNALETASGRPVGVIAFNTWMTSVNDPLTLAVDRHRASAGLVIDLRGNPGGLALMIRGVAGHLFQEPVNLGRMKMRDSELQFPANPRLVMPDGRRVSPFTGPVAVLVDELTVSASECFAGALQSLGRARVFGRTTAGQALPALTKRLPNGDLLMYVVGDFVTATGQRLEGTGVVPDETVPLDAVALRAGRDPDLEAALRWIDVQVAKSPGMLLSSSDLLERLMFSL